MEREGWRDEGRERGRERGKREGEEGENLSQFMSTRSLKEYQTYINHGVHRSEFSLFPTSTNFGSHWSITSRRGGRMSGRWRSRLQYPCALHDNFFYDWSIKKVLP